MGCITKQALWKMYTITFTRVYPPSHPLPGPQLSLCWALQMTPHASQLWANLLSGLEESGFREGVRDPRDMDLCCGQWLFPDPCSCMMGHWTSAIAATVVCRVGCG